MAIKFSDIYLPLVGFLVGYYLDIEHLRYIIYGLIAAGMVPLFRWISYH